MNVYTYDAGNFTPIPVLATTGDIGIQEYIYYSGGQYNYSFSLLTSDRPLQFIEKDTSAARTVIVKHPTSVGLVFFIAQSTGGDTFTNINAATVTSTTEGTDTIYTITVPANYRLAITFAYSSSSGGGAQPWYRYNCYGIVPDAIGTGTLPRWISADIYKMTPGHTTYTWTQISRNSRSSRKLSGKAIVTGTTNQYIGYWYTQPGSRVRITDPDATRNIRAFDGSSLQSGYWYFAVTGGSFVNNTPLQAPLDVIQTGTNEFEFTVPTGCSVTVYGLTNGNVNTALSNTTADKGTDPVPGIPSWQTATLHESTNNIWS